MRYLPLSQSSQNSISSLTQGRTIPHAVGGAPIAGDALASARGQQPSGAVGQRGVGEYMREDRQRKGKDRRNYCRRIQSIRSLPIELRSGVERRSGSRRKGEPTMHIRVKV
ncbi:MAG: hypothetical protein PHH36_05020 [Sideroxydans sp.]|nr:hypothetical protein [Sideroxydans sp.]